MSKLCHCNYPIFLILCSQGCARHWLGPEPTSILNQNTGLRSIIGQGRFQHIIYKLFFSHKITSLLIKKHETTLSLKFIQRVNLPIRMIFKETFSDIKVSFTNVYSDRKI